MLKRLFAFAVAGMAVEPSEASGLDWSQWLAMGDGITPVKADDGDPYVEPRIPRTATKLWRMLRRLQQQGFTSFME